MAGRQRPSRDHVWAVASGRLGSHELCKTCRDPVSPDGYGAPKRLVRERHSSRQVLAVPKVRTAMLCTRTRRMSACTNILTFPVATCVCVCLSVRVRTHMHLHNMMQSAPCGGLCGTARGHASVQSGKIRQGRYSCQPASGPCADAQGAF